MYIIWKEFSTSDSEAPGIKRYLSYPVGGKIHPLGVSDEIPERTRKPSGNGKSYYEIGELISWRDEMIEGALGVVLFDLIEARRISAVTGGRIEKVDAERGQWGIFFSSSHGKAPLCAARKDMGCFTHQDFVLTFNMERIAISNPWIVKFKTMREAEIFVDGFPEQTIGRLTVEKIEEAF